MLNENHNVEYDRKWAVLKTDIETFSNNYDAKSKAEELVLKTGKPYYIVEIIAKSVSLSKGSKT